MKASHLKSTCIILFTTLAFGCSLSRIQNKGDVENESFYYSLQFITAKSVIVLPVEVDGQIKNFIFDTGADLSLLQRDTLRGETVKVGGASKRKMELGQEVIPSMKIGDINFRNTYAFNGDFVGLKEQIPNFGGLLGQPVIKKANWLINFPLKSMEISNKSLLDSSFQKINIIIEKGSPYTYITVDGKRYKALIDLGSTASLSVPPSSPLAQQVKERYSFNENEREIYTLGGLQKVNEHIGTIPEVRLGDITVNDVHTDIRNSSGLRVGIRFFENCVLYIDNIAGDYKVKM